MVVAFNEAVTIITGTLKPTTVHKIYPNLTTTTPYSEHCLYDARRDSTNI